MMGTIRSRVYFTSVKKFTPVKVFGGVNATHIEYGMRGRGAGAYSSGFNGSKARWGSRNKRHRCQILPASTAQNPVEEIGKTGLSVASSPPPLRVALKLVPFGPKLRLPTFHIQTVGTTDSVIRQKPQRRCSQMRC
jgi:hypothetical protein